MATAFFASLVAQSLLFPHLGPGQAKRLMSVIGQILPRHAYVHCNIQCDTFSRQVAPVPMPANSNWAARAPAMWLTNHFACPNRASFRNLASANAVQPAGYHEPSFCVEPRNFPWPGVHLLQYWSQDHPLICMPCKTVVERHLEWQQEELRFGVCRHCREWALNNMQPGQNDCTCEPTGNCANGINNNEPRRKHLCVSHSIAYWTLLERPADTEIDRRRRLQVVNVRWPRKRRGHNWSNRKRAPYRLTLTPGERRRLASRLQGQDAMGGGWPIFYHSPDWQADPRCFCGEFIGAAGHDRSGPDVPAVESERVRNCVGCNEFVRRW